MHPSPTKPVPAPSNTAGAPRRTMLLTIANSFRLACGSLVLTAALAAVATAQQYVPPPPPLVVGPCVPTKKSPCTAPPTTTAPPATPDKFPFPGDAPAPATATPAAAAFPFPGDAEKPATPTPAASPFPFPAESESSSSAATGTPPAPAAADPNPDQPALADKGTTGSTRMERNRARRLLPKVEDLDAREAEDLEVAHYYTTTGNFPAAYMRAKDAVAVIPDDPLAHFALAEAAHNLKKDDEARTEYSLYLKLDPEGQKVKQARQALTLLASRKPA
jgi:hypothetical protein